MGVTVIASTANKTTDEVNLIRVNLVSIEAIAGAQFQWKYLSAAAEVDFSRIDKYSVRLGAHF